MYGVRSEMQSLLFPLSSEYSLKSEVNISQENGQGSQNPFIDYKKLSMRLHREKQVKFRETRDLKKKEGDEKEKAETKEYHEKKKTESKT